MASPTPQRVALGSDGIPTQINGERVYRVTEQAQWEELNGSFLLAATPWFFNGSCPILGGIDAAENDLLGDECSSVSVGIATGSESNGGVRVYLAPRGSPWLFLSGWRLRTVVLRVHTHDAEAAWCDAALRAKCEASAVFEAVVWPAVPTEIGGERVYRYGDIYSVFGAHDLAELSGGFLLGGVVTVNRPAALDTNYCAPPAVADGERQLLHGCASVYIDGKAIAPVSRFYAVDGQVVVVRAHVNDPLAAQCPADVREWCQYAIVVDSVVWISNPYKT